MNVQEKEERLATLTIMTSLDDRGWMDGWIIIAFNWNKLHNLVAHFFYRDWFDIECTT